MAATASGILGRIPSILPWFLLYGRCGLSAPRPMSVRHPRKNPWHPSTMLLLLGTMEREDFFDDPRIISSQIQKKKKNGGDCESDILWRIPSILTWFGFHLERLKGMESCILRRSLKISSVLRKGKRWPLWVWHPLKNPWHPNTINLSLRKNCNGSWFAACGDPRKSRPRCENKTIGPVHPLKNPWHPCLMETDSFRGGGIQLEMAATTAKMGPHSRGSCFLRRPANSQKNKKKRTRNRINQIK